MTHDDWVSLLSALILASICAAIVKFGGGPNWAVAMTFLIIYFTR